eukprot:2896730-Pleurochrysis_carterae.AAC.1
MLGEHDLSNPHMVMYTTSISGQHQQTDTADLCKDLNSLREWDALEGDYRGERGNSLLDLGRVVGAVIKLRASGRLATLNGTTLAAAMPDAELAPVACGAVAAVDHAAAPAAVCFAQENAALSCLGAAVHRAPSSAAMSNAHARLAEHPLRAAWVRATPERSQGSMQN